jgi:hypothetical protein
VTFDLAILRDWFGGYPPWKYKQEMCLRPIRFLGDVLNVSYSEWWKAREATKHSAVEDAKGQAEYLVEVWKRIYNV